METLEVCREFKAFVPGEFPALLDTLRVGTPTPDTIKQLASVSARARNSDQPFDANA